MGSFLLNICITLATLSFVLGVETGNEIIKGRVSNEDGDVLPGITIMLKGTSKGVATDFNGEFELGGLDEGTFVLVISGVGYSTIEHSISIKRGELYDMNIEMEEENTHLEEVLVIGKSIEQEKREQPIKVEVINTKKLQAQSISLPQIINQTSGVKVRQAGGVGSATTININGLQGNAIRFFKDGIPLDYLGRAFDLSLIPVDQLSNIEIYKGVLPVKLGADALGGGVNFITDQNIRNNLGASYSFGSFNTHQFNLNGTFVIPKTPLFASVSSYYVSSDNNYRLEVPVVDENRNQVLREVERFHDEISTIYSELKLGIVDTKFADSWYVNGSFFDLEQDNQNNILLSIPYGEAFSTERTYIGSSRYQKSFDRISVDLFGAYSNRNTQFIDTVNVRYNWFGEREREFEGIGGEISETGSNQDLIFKTWTGRMYLTYDLNEKHQIYFNHNIISEKRNGSDPRAPTLPNSDVDPLSLTATYRRNISGFGVSSSFLGDRLRSEIAVKRYELFTSSVIPFSFDGEVLDFSNVNYGAASSFKYSFNDRRYLRLSYELATRIPDSEEYLGNPSEFILANPELTPETSHNINLGLYANLGKSNRYWLDLNTFYRYINDNIFLIPGLVTSQYRNQDDARSIGAEFGINGEIVKNLNFTSAITYQDIRRVNIQDVSNLLLDGARQPNTPYFFTNFHLRYRKKNLLDLSGEWQFYTNYGFTEKYLLESVSQSQEPSIFGSVGNITDLIIPSQHVVDAGITYRFEKLPIWLNAELNNVLNSEVFDRFRVQRPGTNYRFKIRYQLN